jgi:hypothetical protein
VTSEHETTPIRTPAFSTFDRNTDKLLRFVSTTQPLLDQVASEIKSLSSASGRRAEPLTEAASTVELARSGLASVECLLESFQTILDWTPVLTVTAVETYLGDVLAYAAGVCPELMEKSDQSASYNEVLQASSVQQLAGDLRARWARKFVNDGGPRTWVDRLSRMGARSIPSDVVEMLETLWGVRHLMVHSAGVVTSDFAARHPELKVKVGETLRTRIPYVKSWVSAAFGFVEGTDQYFVQRCASRADQSGA